MRVTTAFKRLLRLPGASVIDVSFTGEGVIVTVVCGAAGACARVAGRPAAGWRSTTVAESAGGIWIWAPAAAGSSASCGCLGAVTAGVRPEPVP
jgi:hypothetical protein